MPQQAKLKWEAMTPHEFREIVQRTPVAYVPLGLLEWHGDHLPLGTDFLKIEGIVLEVARRTGGVVMPSTLYGRPGFGSYCGTMVFSEELVYRMLTELYGQLEKCGFRVIVVLTGHYGPVQVDLVKKTAADYMAKARVRIIAQPEYEGIDPPPADHAGKWETSFSQALYPYLVRMDCFQPGPCPIDRYGDEWAHFPEEGREWVWDEDLRATASPDEGAAMIERIAEHVAGRVRMALAEIEP